MWGKVFCVAMWLLASVHGQQGPLTEDFQNWLNQNGYAKYEFARTDLGNYGSFGGRRTPDERVHNQPVVFIHGNSDAALNYSFTATGWVNSIAYFLSKGYQSSELYATSWGDTDPFNAASRTHDCATLERMRKFLEAVLAYTNASAIDVISHSMGVTIGRKIIKGGTLVQQNGASCDLGASLAANVDTYLGLSGGNYGLCSCEGADALVSATCNQKNGFWPGDSCGFNTLDCGLSVMPFPCNPDTIVYSGFLTDLNRNRIKEGKYVFSAWSLGDDVILFADEVWSRPTSLIPNSNGKKVYTVYTHMETKELTAEDQYDMVVHHTT